MPTKTARLRSTALALVLLTAAACDAGAPSSTPPAPQDPALQDKAAPSPPAAKAPPQGTFVAPEPWQARNKPEVTVAPPDLSKETWRVIVNQYQPHQKKTPKWQLLPATQSVELQMPPGSRHQCVVHPVEVSTATNDFGTELKAWLLSRNLLCSGDGWSTWTEYGHRLRIGADGSREVVYDSEALLRQRDGDTIRHSVVRMRSDKEKREATTGPPRILPGVAVDDD